MLEKAVLCAAESSRHSGIVRSANADNDASLMASLSSSMWQNLEKTWGVGIDLEKFGAIWITKKFGWKKPGLVGTIRENEKD